MKLITVLIMVLLLFGTPVFGELTQADIDKIRLIIKEEVEAAVTKSEERMKIYVSQEIDKVNTRISEMNTRISEMDARLTNKIESLDARLTNQIESLDKRLSGEIEALDKNLNRVFMLVLALVAFIAVVIGIPQILVAMQRKEVRAQDEKIEEQQKRIQALEREMEVYRGR